MTIIRVGVSGGKKPFSRASKRSPRKVSTGPGNMGRTHPAMPRSTRILPVTIAMVSSKVFLPLFTPLENPVPYSRVEGNLFIEANMWFNAPWGLPVRGPKVF
jgi:hypothetical protein